MKLRTQGEVRMTVSGDGAKPYYLIAWVSDEVKPRSCTSRPPARCTPMSELSQGRIRLRSSTTLRCCGVEARYFGDRVGWWTLLPRKTEREK